MWNKRNRCLNPTSWPVRYLVLLHEKKKFTRQQAIDDVLLLRRLKTTPLLRAGSYYEFDQKKTFWYISWSFYR
jgi:hypothetical protein